MDRLHGRVKVRRQEFTMYRNGRAIVSASLLIIFSIHLLLSIDIASSQRVGTYYPIEYNSLGATTRISGTSTHLQSDDSVYMIFRSYQSSNTTIQPIANMNFTSDATGWAYGETNDVNDFASGAWSSTGGNDDSGCYDLITSDTSATQSFDVEQWVNYTFTVDTIPMQAIIYSSYRYTSDGDATSTPKIKLVRPDGSVVDVWTGSTVILSAGSDTNHTYVSADAASTFTSVGTYQLSLCTHANSLKASDKTTVHNYWDDAGITLADPICTAEVEFTGSSDTYMWTELNLTVDSSWTVDSVYVTIQVFDSTAGQYPTGGEGYLAYTSGTANIDETKNQTVAITPAHFRNSTGYWKAKVKGVKKTDAPFDFKADLIKCDIDFSAPSKPFDWAILYALLVVFGVVFISAVKLNRKKKTNTFSELFGMTHQQMIGKKMLLEIDPTSNYHKALLNFASEAKKSSEPLFIFTSTNSALHSALPRAEDVKFFLLTSNVSSLQQINEKVTLLPAHDLSILLNASVEALKEQKEKTINILFDNISSIIIRCGFEKTYSFMHFLLEAVSSPRATALFVFNPAAHDPEISSSIRGLFHIQLAYTKNGPKVGAS